VGRYVQLRQRWQLGDRIGDPSGFGRVFEAEARDGTLGVVKLIPKQPGADRELLFEDLAGVPNVVPIIDVGATADAWAIAMPRAETSLRAELKAAGAPFTVDEAIPVLMDIATALAALDGRVVHRDLKPENVLLLEHRWCLADFGIARYAEASTAPDTWKAAMSAPYAAPERWRFERATGATDIYSLGVVAFEMLAGSRPFGGPEFDDYRDQHLHQAAPDLQGVPATIASLVAECLLKAPAARPSATNVVARLQRALTTPSPGAGRLQAADHTVRAEQARELARLSAEATTAERRRSLFESGAEVMKRLSAQLRQAIIDNAPAATPAPHGIGDDWTLRLGPAVIGMDPTQLSPADPWGGWTPAFDVVAHAGIGITIPEDRYGFTGRAHSLWYCDAQEPGLYRWYEAGFMISPMIPRQTKTFPIAFDPCENAGKALSNAMTEWQVAWPFTPVDQGEEVAFIERWLDWFGLAAQGELHRPSSTPERPIVGSWRRS
jgi:hypothetical protein